MVATTFPSLTTPEAVISLQWVGDDRLVVAGVSGMGLYERKGNLLASAPEGARRLAWSPGAAFVRYLKAHPEMVECSSPCDWDWATQSIRKADPGVYYSMCCTYDRVGNFVHGGELYEWGYWTGIDQKGDRIVGTTHIPILFDLAFSPDGAWLLTGGRRSHLAIWAFPPEHPSQPSHGDKVFQPGAGIVTSVAWSDSGKHIAAGLVTGKVEVWEVESSQMVAEININLQEFDTSGQIRKIRFVPGAEGLMLASTNYSTTVINWREKRIISEAVQWNCFDLSPSGKEIALGNTEGAVCILDLAYLESRDDMVYEAGRSVFKSEPRFSPLNSVTNYQSGSI